MNKKRVAILGGGLSGMVTAFYLTDPAQRDKYDVTVYQLGWRLGGKCATGRNEDHHERIQEHGLHVFMGAYQNAFQMFQELYEKAPVKPFETWDKAFTKVNKLTLMDKLPNGEYVPWVINMPSMPGTPGIDIAPDIWGRMQQILEWIEEAITHTLEPAFGGPDPSNLPWWKRMLYRLIIGIEHGIAHAATILIKEALELIETLVYDTYQHSSHHHSMLAGLFEGLRSWISRRAAKNMHKDADVRQFWIMADLGLTSLIGGLRDGLLFDPDNNLERVNQMDYKEWLAFHGAHEETVNSATVRGLYDLIFAYPKGDWTKPGEVEAGTMFVSLMNTATYQGSMIWKFNTATGDMVMQPMYDLLIQRGAKVEFFHRVDRLVPSDDGSQIDKVEIGRQVKVPEGGYDPLRTLPSGQRVWPDRPLYDRIIGGDTLKASGADLESHWSKWKDAEKPLTLKAGEDFDEIVLAIPPAAHSIICRDLIRQKAAWRKFNSTIRTTATQSLQTWMSAREPDLGWDEPSLVGSYDITNLNSWCDITEVLNTECWPASADVHSEQIFCGPLPCPDALPPSSENEYPIREQELVDEGGQQFLDHEGHNFWKNRFGLGGPAPGVIKSIYNRANIDPSERYTLTVKNSTKYRMTASGSTYSNLYLTGDWIQNGQNLGSFEATTISGKLASHAISGYPTDIRGVDAKALAKAEYPPRPVSTPGKFVSHNGMSTFPGPISLADTTMWAFLIEADHDRMTDYCKQMFDDPSGGAVKVRPLTSLMMMTIVDIKDGRFKDAPQMGWSPERELTFWIPAVRVEDKGGREVAKHFEMVMPYLVLDNPVAIASGREIFGYQKQRGWLSVPGDEGNDAGDLTVDLFSTQTFGEATQEQRHRLLTLSHKGESDHSLLHEISDFAGAAKTLWKHMHAHKGGWHNSLAFDVELLGDLLHKRVPQLFLKQFRDVSDGERACYQAITRAMGEVTKFDAFPKLIEWDMQLEHLDSSPVAKQFGIAPEQKLHGVRLTYDMLIHPGEVIWQC
ncbi:NAD(P)-binding protein [Altererythrobacter sp.]|uniref:NAD(P)-binding protein n=1 Tax=Altererythrobacter sp. TaxID=1872480 RepID=UPI001B1F1D88|nr:NAD(P)-binding protein [Altererythrobacter sp.]MBO6610131.1 NAD(P)-binding protein [Altererythrobacter sp.]MBO6641872.1 NAD(P)-binding protein [Altererythrobacter sp.]MBO6709860.1 NAD(P)-binding protein [Altererythrobacter sp.]